MGVKEELTKSMTGFGYQIIQACTPRLCCCSSYMVPLPCGSPNVLGMA